MVEDQVPGIVGMRHGHGECDVRVREMEGRKERKRKTKGRSSTDRRDYFAAFARSIDLCDLLENQAIFLFCPAHPNPVSFPYQKYRVSSSVFSLSSRLMDVFIIIRLYIVVRDRRHTGRFWTRSASVAAAVP